MARFWNQLDKADHAVPLVFTKYKDASELQHIQLQPPLHAHQDRVTIDTQQSRTTPRTKPAARPPRRSEYKAYRDVKPTKMIRARSQYLPPDEKSSLETSYSATYKGQAPLRLDNKDHKALDRRRIRSLYSEPYMDPSHRWTGTVLSALSPNGLEAPRASQGRKPKDKAERRTEGLQEDHLGEPAESRPAAGDKEKSKEMNNKLAEAKE
ncbi:hypothetical protein KUCAC02_002943 [Chaenocephalus aceratus]|uniref:Uncharacterized protein n=1 Tax=Chaenocephalus aceratus TaxID=36190 RepID=A0ACB9WJ38_CHAAC|nr:hypothetical protein KUCAC02_002943 [Chaenocephalus aceratus]